MKHLWGKRFEKQPSALAEAFTSGRDVRGIAPADERLIPTTSGAAGLMWSCWPAGDYPRRDARLLISGLKEIEKAWKGGKFRLDPSQEDVHSNVESRLVRKWESRWGGSSTPPVAGTIR